MNTSTLISLLTRTNIYGSSWPSQCWSPSLSAECYAPLCDAVKNDTVHSLISQLVQAVSGGTSQWKRQASYSS